MMKLKLIIILLFSLCFAGCLDIEEVISFNKKGKGHYSMNMEMGEMMKMLKTFGGTDSAMMPGMKDLTKPKDSIIEFGKMIDSFAYLSAEEKKLLRPATIRIHIDPEQSAMNIKTDYPFSSFDDFNKMMAALAKIGQNSGKKQLADADREQGGDPTGKMFEDLFGNNGMGNFSSFKVTKNRIEREMPEERKKMMSQLQENKQMGSALMMLSSVKFKTILQLPRKVKKSSGAGIEISKDKKTVTISSTFGEMLTSPEAFDFRIEY